jgi:hypothetical protein
VLRWASPGARRLPRPDLVEWPLADADGLTALRALRARWDQARAVPLLPGAGGVSLPKLGLVASGADADLLAAALPLVDAVLLQDPTPDATAALARATRAAGQPLWLETRVTAEFTPGSGQSSSDGSEPAPVSDAVARLLAAVAAARAAGQPDLVLAVSVPAPSSTRAFQRPALPLDGRPENVPDLPVSVVETARGRGGEAAPHVAWQIYAGRLLAAALATAGDDAAVFLRSQPSDDPLIDAALPLGSLLCDGVGDLIQAGTPAGGQAEAELSLNVLQAAGTRLSKTDYVACPSCGRTLFDLQSTTERIKSRTAHLAGVKIAIMGCIVNGPGEMADADFGYVGGSPGHVNLYVGKACVERNVPAEVADEHLVALIKARGRWEEPEEE